MVNLTSFLMIYTFIKLSLIIKELEANEISTLKSLGCILQLLIKHSKTSYAMYITMNSARIPRESKIHCYSNITDDISHQTQTLISTQSRKIIP